MSGKHMLKLSLLIVLLLLTDAGNGSGIARKPSCGDMEEIMACPLNLAPVCGSDGVTYPNECALCVQRQVTKADLLVVKEESCFRE